MITYLRHLLRKNETAGLILTSLYLLFRFATSRGRLPLACMATFLTIIGLVSLSRDNHHTSVKSELASPRYTVTDLGDLFEGSGWSAACGINQSGQIVGASGLASEKKHLAFLWENGKMTNLGALNGGNSRAVSINSSGLIVGESLDSGPIYSSAVCWRSRQIERLDVGGTYSYASCVNDQGEIAGSAGSPGSYDTVAFLWRNGSTKMGPFIPSGMNSDGKIAGFYADPRNLYATIYDKSGLHHLKSFGDGDSRALAINASGQIVGSYDLPNTWTEAPALWSGDKTIALHTLGGKSGSAKAINDLGKIVGESMNTQGEMHACLWDNGIVDLNKTIQNDSGWVLKSATGINKKGQIVGYGDRDGQKRAFLLNPVKSL